MTFIWPKGLDTASIGSESAGATNAASFEQLQRVFAAEGAHRRIDATSVTMHKR
jgi:hypothetical protein